MRMRPATTPANQMTRYVFIDFIELSIPLYGLGFVCSVLRSGAALAGNSAPRAVACADHGLGDRLRSVCRQVGGARSATRDCARVR